jgi:hypothetical protein
MTGTQALGGPVDRACALLPIPPLDRDEPHHVKAAAEDWQLLQFRLVKDQQVGSQAPQCEEQDGRLDITRVVHAINGGTGENVLLSFNRVPDPHDRQPRPRGEET